MGNRDPASLTAPPTTVDRRDGPTSDLLVVLVNGAGPGVGKSTIARALVTTLRKRGLTAELFAEDEILRRCEFRSVIEEFRGRPRVELSTLLAASGAYLCECVRRSKGVYVLDSLFPYWLSLAAWNYSIVDVEQFFADLVDVAAGVRIIEIFVEGNLTAGIQRAAAREDAGWIEGQIDKVSDFPHVESALQEASDLVEYYRQIADERPQVAWPVKVVDGDRNPELVLADAVRFVDSVGFASRFDAAEPSRAEEHRQRDDSGDDSDDEQ